MDSIAKRLRAQRISLGLTSDQLGEIGKITPCAQVDYETGEQDPDADYLAKISKVGVDIMYVLTGELVAGQYPKSSDYEIDPKVAAHLPPDVISVTAKDLHQMLWETAEALSELSALQHPQQDHPPEHYINQHLKAFSSKAKFREAVLQGPRTRTRQRMN